MAFNPNDYIINLQGKKYLQVAHRVLWFKTEHPTDGAITTDILQTEPYPIVKATIYVSGVVMATGHGTAQVKEKAVYRGRELEKAETAAIGRALANAGYGTQFSEMVDDDSEDLADSPQERATKPQNGASSNSVPTPSQPPQNAPKNAYQKAMEWAKSNNYDISKHPYPNNRDSEVVAREWCEMVKEANS